MNNQKKEIPYITIILVAINVIAFFVLELLGDTEDAQFMYEHGAMYTEDIIEHGQLYRIFSSMFLHFGLEHLAYNMFMLAVIGYNIESVIGRVKYLVIYLISGLAGNILSMITEINSADPVVSAGASGAIFGVFGLMVIMIFKSRKVFGQDTAIRLIVLVVIMVFGNMEEGVDWMAHLGGAIAGIIMGLILYNPKKSGKLLYL